MIEVLVSCMHQHGMEIIDASNLNAVKTLVINQTDCEDIEDDGKNHRMLSTTTRGLSISRNMAIANATGEICVFADDDEYFVDDLSTKIGKAFDEIKDADIILFEFDCAGKIVHHSKIKKIKKLDTLKVASCQIAFRRKSVQNKIQFDKLLGAGTLNGGGEENKFILDAIKAGLKVYKYPLLIGAVKQSNSTWFRGYNKDFFYKRGMSTRYIYGLCFSSLYAVYFLIAKRNIYKNNISMLDAAKYLFLGIKENRLLDV